MARQTRRSIGTTLVTLVLGLLGAFVVAVSVFADGAWAERRLLILAILAGYVFPPAFWQDGLLGRGIRRSWLSGPALPALILFGEDTTLALVYIALIVACAVLGAGAGAWARVRRKKSRS